jgi:hypothetical protein
MEWKVKLNNKSISVVDEKGRVICNLDYPGYVSSDVADLAALISRAPEIIKMEKFHPRAVKLMQKCKPFVVVAEDEVYFPAVYRMIREDEICKGRWTMDDQWAFEQALAKHELREQDCDAAASR